MSTVAIPVQILDRISSYSYFDTPDGYDVHLKIFYCLKQAIRVGGFFIITDVMTISRPVGWLATVDRIGYLYKPWIHCALTYPIIANFSCLIRGKDDYWNHVLAAAVTSWVFGRYAGGAAGVLCSVPMMIGCGFFKQGTLDGYRATPIWWNQMGEKLHYSTSIYTQTKQHGFLEQRPKSWTSLENYMSQQK